MKKEIKEYFKKQFDFSLKHFVFTDCPYYPCHKFPEGQDYLNCLFCYCPLYPCKKEKRGGKWIMVNNKKVWDCSNCNYIHKDKVVKKILKKLYK